MKTWDCEIRDLEGLHARPACMMASVARKYHADVLVRCQSKEADGKDVMKLLDLNARYGDHMIVEVSGEDEDDALDALKQVFYKK